MHSNLIMYVYMQMAISSTILISKFVDLNSQMVAQQLTWAEHKIYCAIHPQSVKYISALAILVI